MSFPKHIAIVMDGNGRWAQRRRRPRTMGHQAGLKAAKEVVRAAGEAGVEILTLFAFSSENWKRPPAEVKRLMDLFLKALKREMDELDRNNVKLRFIGDRTRLSSELRTSMDVVERRTETNTGMQLVIAINYGGRWDVAQAAQRIARAVLAGEISVDEIDEHSVHAGTALGDVRDPDLLIRTGGEQRISNFLLWQAAYTEFFFSETLWPDFGPEDLHLAIEDFGHRQRRFGRIAEQDEASKQSA